MKDFRAVNSNNVFVELSVSMEDTFIGINYATRKQCTGLRTLQAPVGQGNFGLQNQNLQVAGQCKVWTETYEVCFKVFDELSTVECVNIALLNVMAVLNNE